MGLWQRKQLVSELQILHQGIEEYAETAKASERRYKDGKAVPNTMKLHSVAGISAQIRKTRATATPALLMRDLEETLHVGGRRSAYWI